MQAYQVDEQYYRMLHQIQAVDFVLVELNLYLDTHPNDTQALHQYLSTLQKRKELVMHFERRYGPLTPMGDGFSETYWNWNKPPWPWQV